MTLPKTMPVQNFLRYTSFKGPTPEDNFFDSHSICDTH